MVDKTIHDLASLASPAVDDEVGVWDLSAGQYVRVAVNALIGAALLNPGALDLNGKSAVLPANGTLALLEAANVFAAAQTIPNALTGLTGVMADDTAISFTPNTAYGVLVLWSRLGGYPNRCGIAHFRAMTTPHCAIIAQPATDLVATNTVLTGTTGTDGKITIGAYSDGKIYIENRMGGSINIGYVILGG